MSTDQAFSVEFSIDKGSASTVTHTVHGPSPYCPQTKPLLSIDQASNILFRVDTGNDSTVLLSADQATCVCTQWSDLLLGASPTSLHCRLLSECGQSADCEYRIGATNCCVLTDKFFCLLIDMWRTCCGTRMRWLLEQCFCACVYILYIVSCHNYMYYACET